MTKEEIEAIVAYVDAAITCAMHPCSVGDAQIMERSLRELRALASDVDTPGPNVRAAHREGTGR